ncbi:MAG TPA: bifunctional UDP-sugar hydrolase/5'-nucleotidase [Pseudogracilibacillus sp.]|nr:bifunctional UDP-sugar hydrolase/5'-nucleotidase [Pseudogracilibacillus sp.]
MRKKLYGIVLSLVLLLALLVPSASQVEASEAEKEVTVLFTHDLHDNLYPFSVEKEGKTSVVGGYARLATAIEEERQKHEHTVLVDAGDYAMGTLFQTIYATQSPSLRLMGEFDYDAVTLGNHEFDFRAEGLTESLLRALESGDPLPDIVASNVIYPSNEDGKMDRDIAELKEAMDAYGASSYKIIERGDIKIGIFGLVGEDADSNAPMSGVEFEPIVDASKRMVKQLKDEGVDMIIAASHSGTSEQKKTSEDEVLAEKVPEIDVIVSGHSHTFLYEPIVIKDTVIGSAGEYGQNLGVMTLRQKDNGRWDLVDYHLKPVNEELAVDEAIAEKIEGFKADVQAEYLDHFDMEFEQVLGKSSFNITDYGSMYDRHAEDALGNLIGDAYIETVAEHDEADAEAITAAVVPVGTIRNSLYEGEITVSDVFNVSSLGIGPDKISGYPLVEVYLTGKELKTVAEVDASVSPLMPSAQLYVAGLSYTFNPNRLIFNKVTDVKIQEKDGKTEEIVDDKLYRLVAGLYSGQMLPVVSEKSFGLLSLVPKDKTGEPIVNFEDHIMYMNDGTKREIKEWYAIANYISSFDMKENMPEMPDYYAQLQNRKVVNDTKNILALAKNPNGIALAIYGIGIAGIVVLVLILRFFIRRRKKKRREGKVDRVS